MAPVPVLTDALARGADRLADTSAALELEAAELADTGHLADARHAHVEAVAARVAAEHALDELVDLAVGRLLGDARRMLDRP